jgi:mannose-6-phosphate isomerase-like protein (cupin superfamily)
MKHRQLALRRGFRIVLGNRHSQAAEMVLAPGSVEGGPRNRHRGADQWLYVVDGTGTALVNRRNIALRRGTLLLIERRDEHQIKNTGRRVLKTLNLYVPPAYSADGDELAAGKS